MYPGVPITTSVFVITPLVLNGTLEIPKSSTLTKGVPSGRVVKNRFAALMSRWTISFAWASASASHA